VEWFKWFCRKCWRQGELRCASDDAIAEAQNAHRRDVNYDSQSLRVPVGVVNFGPDPIKLAGAYCYGDIVIIGIGESLRHKTG